MIVLGSDYAGFSPKEILKKSLARKPRLMDVGTEGDEPVDYPDVAEKVGQAIRRGQARRGILICGSGVGASVAGNKIRGIRAGWCHDTYSAHQGVEHDNINVLVLGARGTGGGVGRGISRRQVLAPETPAAAVGENHRARTKV